MQPSMRKGWQREPLLHFLLEGLCLDFGIDLGSPVGLEYYDQAPFTFNGTIGQAHVGYTK